MPKIWMDHRFEVEIIDEAIPARESRLSQLQEKLIDYKKPIPFIQTLGSCCRYFIMHMVQPTTFNLVREPEAQLNIGTLEVVPNIYVQIEFIGNLGEMKGVRADENDYPLKNHAGVYASFWPQPLSDVNINARGLLTVPILQDAEWFKPHPDFPTHCKTNTTYYLVGRDIQKQFQSWGLPDARKITPGFVGEETDTQETRQEFRTLMERVMF